MARPTIVHGDEEGVVHDVDRGGTAMRVLSFRGPGWVRVVIPGGLERDGVTLRREEAAQLRDALIGALADIDTWRADRNSTAADGGEHG